MDNIIFLFAQEFLKIKQTQRNCRLWNWLALIMILVFLCFWVYAQVAILPHNHYIQKCVQSLDQPMKQDQVGIMYYDLFSASLISDLKNLSKKYNPFHKDSQQFIETDQCLVVVNAKQNNNTNRLLFSRTEGLLDLSAKNRQQMEFVNQTFYFKNVPLFVVFFYDIHMLRANQLFKMSKNNNQSIYIKTPYVQTSSEQHHYKSWTSIISCILLSIVYYGIVSIFLQFFVREVLNMWLIVFSMFHHLCHRRQDAIAIIRKHLPWIGMRLSILLDATNEKIKKGSFYFYLANLLQFVLFYCLLAVLYLNGADIFIETQEKYLLFWLFFDMYGIEFAGFLFLRNRASMKYFPILHSFLMVWLLVYIQMGELGCGFLMTMICMCADVFLFTWFVVHVEIKTLLDNEYIGFKPTQKQTRVGLMSVYNINWTSLEPDLWVSLFPLMSEQADIMTMKDQRMRQFIQS